MTQHMDGFNAHALFGNANAKLSQDLIKKAKNDALRGATEQAVEHLRRAEIPSAVALLNETSALLSQQENVEWIYLRNKSASIMPGGMIELIPIPSHEYIRLVTLTRRAYGIDSTE